MGSFRLEKKALVVLEGARMRVRREVREGSVSIWQLEDEVSGAIVQRNEEELFRLHYNGELRFIGAASTQKGKTSHHQLTDMEKEEIHWRLPFVKAVLGIPIVEARYKSVIDKVWQSFQKGNETTDGFSATRNRKVQRKNHSRPPGWISVYRWREQYFRSGRDAYALLSRERKRPDHIDPDLVQVIDEALEENYLIRERKSLQEVINTAKQNCREKNESRERLGLPLLCEPTRWQVEKRLANIPAIDRYAARFGRDQARARFRSVMGHRVTTEPLERVEIDHTPLDLFVVDDNGLPLGRPYITTCIDDFTRCVLGMYSSFVPPSYESVARCLMHAFFPKVTQKEEFPEVEHPWCAYGVMQTLVCDNGVEFHSEALEHACEQLGIDTEYAPRKTGWYKAKIERFLRTLNTEVAHGNRGTTFSNIFERCDYNPENHAVIRLSTLKLGLRIWVCDVYHQRKHHALNMPPEAMWRLHARTEDILVPGDRNGLQLVMGRPYSRMLTHKGIEFAGLYYGSEDTHELRRRFGPVLQVEIRVNQENIGEIHVLYGQDVVTARSLKFDYADGLSLWLHEQIKKHSPKYDPDVWLAGKERLRRLFKNEDLAMRRLPRRGKGRVFEQLGSKELSQPEQVKQLPAPAVTLEAGECESNSNLSAIPDIPQYKVIEYRGGN